MAHPNRNKSSSQRPGKSSVVAACTFELPAETGAAVQLLPAGAFRARDGRPHDADSWRLDAAIAAAVIARAEARANDFVFDYEHQTLHAEANGQPAPASGWFKQLEWREGDGLFTTDVRWTARAKEMIAGGEYRYVSTVFRYRPQSGEVVEILHAALTNDPALDGMDELTVRAAARFSPSTPDEEDTHVTREQLIALLGLAETATDDEISTALAALKARADQVSGLESSVAALRAQAENPDPARFVPIATFQALQGEYAALKAESGKREVDELVEQALADGKLLPAMKDWAENLGKTNLAALKTYIDNAPAIEALKGTQTKGKQPDGGGDGALSEAELAVCKATGIDPEEFRKTKAAG